MHSQMQCQLYEPIQIKLSIKNNLKFIKIITYCQYHIAMSKQKQLRRIVLDKLYVRKKNQAINYNLKKSTRSNAPTESTPNQAKNQYKQIERFFENFQSQCAIIYQPVILTHRKPVKRNLQSQLLQLDKHSRLKTEAFYEQQNRSGKRYSRQKKSQVGFNSNSKIRLSTDYSQQIVQKNSSFFEFNKNDKNNCGSLIKNKSTIIKKIPTQSSTFGSKIYQNKSTVVFTSTTSKYTSPTSKFKPYSRPFSKRQTPYDNQFSKKIQESANYQKKIDSQLKNAPKKLVNPMIINPQKIKRVHSLRQFNGMKKLR